MELLEKWIYECLGALIKEPTEENRKIVAKTIASEIEDCEQYESEIKELKSMLKQARKLLMLSKKECIYNGDEFQTEYRIKCNDFIGKIKHYLDEIEKGV